MIFVKKVKYTMIVVGSSNYVGVLFFQVRDIALLNALLLGAVVGSLAYVET